MRRHTGRRRALRFKRGVRAADRTHEGRSELEIARPGGREGPPDRHVPLGRPDLRLHRGEGAPVLHPKDRCAAGRPGLRCGLVPQCSDRDGNFAVHPVPYRPEGPHPARRRPLPPASQDREHVRPPQGLAPDRHTIRSLPHPVPLGLRIGRNRHLLVVSPDSRTAAPWRARTTGRAKNDLIWVASSRQAKRFSLIGFPKKNDPRSTVQSGIAVVAIFIKKAGMSAPGPIFSSKAGREKSFSKLSRYFSLASAQPSSSSWPYVSSIINIRKSLSSSVE